ncbi:tRNA (adenosine(37)-N6)-dimethylallyltransferase MiaA [Bacillus solimangrovi]|uniref:tRNA dimethylallyltransferase n=1 Tax=Bacillus solimangrovi TaxID=1305675 RepID=A0A1E5LJ52_9BACI|nr:tRNA (adenosine(37)-N6)-dimethylallyltransferase MiaA [Bacillus solimangrovi]OEH94123.1 tRNA (adenosine(37)-N6)-dimethylallyltransferase MiaA [Bacillus solimangrovi]
MREKVIAIVGPTAVGKTKLSVELAKRLDGEVISGDSMQIYRDMNIGTAKVTTEEMQGITHHMIDIKNFNETFSVAEFQQTVRRLISDINAKGRLPILAGGTGLYIQSVLYDYQFSDASSDEDFRLELEEFAKLYGNEALHEKLQQVDIKSASNIHPNNVRRVIRALEVFHVTGMTMHEYQEQQSLEPCYQDTIIGLTTERDKLYDRINKRVDEMIDKGLFDEVKGLYEVGLKGTQAGQAIGYKEVISFIEGQCSKEDAISQLKQNSRRYAKRQFTWFRNKMDITWFDLTEDPFEQKLEEILHYIAGKLS